MAWPVAHPITFPVAHPPGADPFGPVNPPPPPIGFAYLKGADGAYLKGADGAYLLGAA